MNWFDGCLIISILLLVISWKKQYIFKEGTEKYKLWYRVFELGWWLFFIGLLKYIF